jgi:flagellar basal body rod protein FlgG
MYKSAWGAVASQLCQEAVANNMANVNTVGFKPDGMVLRGYKTRSEAQHEALRPDRRVLWQVGGGAMVAESRTALVSGPVQDTGTSTDLAILGDRGFFAVEREGAVRYTRAGNFRVDAAGFLVTADGGWRVLDDGGSEIQVGGPGFTVGADGSIRRLNADGEEELARLALVDFEEPGRLLKDGRTGFVAPAGVEPLEARPDSRIQQGALEMSGTNAAATMVSMIEAARSYEANMNFVRVHDQMLGKAVSEIARLGG